MRTHHEDHRRFPFGPGLTQEAVGVQKEISSLPQGKARELQARKARQIETASHVNEWVASPGLQAPK